jgi:hypothetical protein
MSRPGPSAHVWCILPSGRRQGEVINIPYELTVSTSFRDFWQSAFYSHDRLNTSTPFARKVRSQHHPQQFGHGRARSSEAKAVTEAGSGVVCGVCLKRCMVWCGVGVRWQLGFQDQVLPFSLMLFLTGSMSHADAATVQVRRGRVAHRHTSSYVSR